MSAGPTEAVLREWARSAAARLLAVGGNGGRTDVRSLARQHGVTGIEIADLELDGLLIPVESGFKMRVRANAPAARQRWTVAHELAHTLFFRLEERAGPPSRAWPGGLPQDGDEERACDLVAEYILLPDEEVRGFAEDHTVSIDTLSALAGKYAVSDWAVARALTARGLWDAVVLSVARETVGGPYRLRWGAQTEPGVVREPLVPRRTVRSSSPQLARCIGGWSAKEVAPLELRVAGTALRSESAEICATGAGLYGRTALCLLKRSTLNVKDDQGLDDQVQDPGIPAQSMLF